jgi:hypothetical protein
MFQRTRTCGQNTREREAALKSLSVEECYFKALHEMTINALNGNIPLKYFQKQVLKRHKNRIKALVCAKRRSRKDKTKAFTQRGGWLQFLIPAAGALLSGLINRN